jgi:predicted CXXCH cytochrome family protein
MKTICRVLASLLIICLPAKGMSDTLQRNNAYTSEEVHGKSQDCAICHIMNSKNEAVQLIQPITKLCTSCHPDRKTPSEHIVDIVPSMAVNGLPLMNGNMTCVSCHDSHENRHKAMLRVDPKDLCLLCHNF